MACFISYAAPPATVAKPQNPDFTKEQLLQFYNMIAERVRSDYVEEVTNRHLLEGSLQGMVSALDPHSAYLTQEQFQQLREQAEGKFGGLGIEVMPEERGIRVITPMEDAPAEKAGIKPGDLIIAVETESIAAMAPEEAIKKLRGEPGTTVTVTIQRDKQIIQDLKIKRAIIKVNPIKWKIEGQVGYIRIATFNESTTTDLLKAIQAIKQKLGKDLIGFVVDVRNNAGGLYEQAISVSEHFLNPGKPVVSIRYKDPKKTIIETSKARDMTEGRPLVVLVNAGSASASEIFAGAMQDHKRAIVVGTRTFGKGSVQRISTIPPLGALKLTIARYYTPSGRSIQKEGIEPDITVEQHLDLKTINSDKRLREAYLKDALKNGSPITEESTEQEEQKLRALQEQANFKDLPDYQLQQALNILKAISLGLK
jgi:carboxyl-terminal processing protease